MPDAHTAERRKVVLVVEDEKAIGQLIADAISDEPGFTAIHVAGAAAALEATKHVIPLYGGSASLSVLTRTNTRADMRPLVTHIFWPLIS